MQELELEEKCTAEDCRGHCSCAFRIATELHDLRAGQEVVGQGREKVPDISPKSILDWRRPHQIAGKASGRFMASDINGCQFGYNNQEGQPVGSSFLCCPLPNRELQCLGSLFFT